ncbi:MAG: T9SS type A sorting domain-containing protein, partial [Leptolyngbya sp. SIO3F4]|nr:T9SS type A sorting domain-containing protein [Leptolyngbya sp. SIO3F4]
VKQVSDISGPILVSPDIEEDEFLQQEVVEPVIAHLEGLALNVIATSEVNLDGVRNNVRGIETNLGNLIADAMLWQANQVAGTTGFENVPQATVGIQNGGGIRNNNVIAPGDFTELNTFDILPFGNFVSVVENIGPAQFKELVENAVSRSEDVENNSGTGRFAQIAGFSIIYDSTATAITFDDNGNTTTEGMRVLSITLDDGVEIVKGGTVVDGAPSVNIAIADFSARGGDQYPFRDATFTPLGVSYQQALFNFITTDSVDGGLGGLITAAAYPEGGENRIVVQICEGIDKPTISVTDGTDAEGAIFVLSSSATEGNQWFLDGVAISGATGQTYNVTQSGSYTVQVIDGSCTSEISEAFAVTALDENIAMLDNSLVIYPNPTNDLLHLNWDRNLKLNPVIMEIFSTDGRKLLSKDLENSSYAIQVKLGQFTNGLYIIKLKGEGFTLQKKIIKQ